MIIVEGPDGSGKTTLCRMLTGAFDLSYIKNPGMIKNKETITERFHWYHYLYKQKNVILDRFYPISEAIYGPLFRDKSMVSDFTISDEIVKFFCYDNHNNILIWMKQKFKHVEHISAEKSIHTSTNEKIIMESKVTEKQDEIIKLYNTFYNKYLKYNLLNQDRIIVVNNIEDYENVIYAVGESIA